MSCTVNWMIDPQLAVKTVQGCCHFRWTLHLLLLITSPHCRGPIENIDNWCLLHNICTNYEQKMWYVHLICSSNSLQLHICIGHTCGATYNILKLLQISMHQVVLKNDITRKNDVLSYHLYFYNYFPVTSNGLNPFV